MKGKKGKDKAMIGFHIEQQYKDRIEAISGSLKGETKSDVVEAILKAFFTANPAPMDIEKGRGLVIKKRKEEIRELWDQ